MSLASRYLEARKELAQFREQAKSRRADAVDGVAESTEKATLQAASESAASTVTPPPPGFALWQLVLVYSVQRLLEFLLNRVCFPNLVDAIHLMHRQTATVVEKGAPPSYLLHKVELQ